MPITYKYMARKEKIEHRNMIRRRKLWPPNQEPKLPKLSVEDCMDNTIFQALV